METFSIRAEQGYMGKKVRRGMIYFPINSVWSDSIDSESVETEPQGCNLFVLTQVSEEQICLTLIGNASTWPISQAP